MKLIVKVIFKFLSALITIVLSPIDYLISSTMPTITSALSSVSSFFSWLTDFTQWVLSWLPFDEYFYTFIIAFLIFKYTIQIAVNAAKIIVNWWHALAP